LGAEVVGGCHDAESENITRHLCFLFDHLLC